MSEGSGRRLTHQASSPLQWARKQPKPHDLDSGAPKWPEWGSEPYVLFQSLVRGEMALGGGIHFSPAHKGTTVKTRDWGAG